MSFQMKLPFKKKTEVEYNPDDYEDDVEDSEEDEEIEDSKEREEPTKTKRAGNHVKEDKKVAVRQQTESSSKSRVNTTSDANVLAVWGSPGSGKTTVAIKLAEHLASKGKNTLLILSDMTTPPVPYLCNPSDLMGERSLGSILAAAHVSESLVKRNCMFYRKNKYLSIIGMLKGENRFTYPPYEDVQARELLMAANEIVPYVIIDCSSHIATNKLTGNALMMADTVLRLVNCDLKSISYFSSQLPLLADEKWQADHQIKIASNVKPNEACGSVEQVLGTVGYRLPYSKEVETQFLEGEMLKELNAKDSKTFRKEIERISLEVFGV